MAADPAVFERIQAMGSKELDDLIVELTLFAAWQISVRTKWMPRGVLPMGFDAESLALEAIGRVLDGRRCWNPAAEPDFLRYLKSVVPSILWDLQKAAEKEKLEPGSDEIEGSVEALPSGGPGPDEETELEDTKNRMLAAFDDANDQLVLLCLFEGITKPSEIADETNLSVKDVNRIKQKIQRRLICLKGS